MTSQSAERIGGWLLAPLAWLLVALLSASLSLLFLLMLSCRRRRMPCSAP